MYVFVCFYFPNIWIWLCASLSWPPSVFLTRVSTLLGHTVKENAGAVQLLQLAFPETHHNSEPGMDGIFCTHTSLWRDSSSCSDWGQRPTVMIVSARNHSSSASAIGNVTPSKGGRHTIQSRAYKVTWNEELCLSREKLGQSIS